MSSLLTCTEKIYSRLCVKAPPPLLPGPTPAPFSLGVKKRAAAAAAATMHYYVVLPPRATRAAFSEKAVSFRLFGTRLPAAAASLRINSAATLRFCNELDVHTKGRVALLMLYILYAYMGRDWFTSISAGG